MKTKKRTAPTFRFCLLAWLLSGAFSLPLPAQQPVVSIDPEASQQLLEAYESRFALMDSLVFRLPVLEADSVRMHFVVSERVAEIDRAVEAQIAAMKARTGLEVRGQAYIRPGAGLSYDPEDPLVAYNAKFQVDLQWNIFQSSLHKRTSKIRELRIKGEISQMEHERRALQETLLLQRLSARDQYYGQLLTLLYIHADNLSVLMNTQKYLLANGKISSDDLLKLISEQAEIERQRIALEVDSVIAIPAHPSATRLVSIDTAALMMHIRQGNRDLKKLALRQDLLEAQRKNIDYLQTMSIHPFVRFSYYNRENVPNTHNLDVGVSFVIPLSAETARQRKALKVEQGVMDYERLLATEQIDREVQALLYDIHNYNENIRGEYERMLRLKDYLDMRSTSYANVAGEYSRIDRLQEYNAYLQAWERMLSYAYQRDSKLIDLQRYAEDEPISKFLFFTELK